MRKEFDDSLYHLKMDAAVHNALLACKRAAAEHRPLTQLEAMGIRLATIERDAIWQSMLEDAKSAGVCVPRWDQEQVYGYRRRDGVRFSNDAGRMKRIYLYGTIEHDLTAKSFQDSLNLVADDEPIELHINSDGGNLFESIAIHNLIRDRVGLTRGVVDSIAASGASLILVACKDVEMTVGSWIMLHGVRGTWDGLRTAEEMQDSADRLRRSNEQLFELYGRRWKGTDDELRTALANELWLDHNEAVAFGLADRVSREMAMAASIDSKKFKYENTPATLVLSAQSQSDRIQVGRRKMELIAHRASIL